MHIQNLAEFRFKGFQKFEFYRTYEILDLTKLKKIEFQRTSKKLNFNELQKIEF